MGIMRKERREREEREERGSLETIFTGPACTLSSWGDNWEWLLRSTLLLLLDMGGQIVSCPTERK